MKLNTELFNTSIFNPLFSWGPRTVSKSDVLNTVQFYLNDPNAKIWPVTVLSQYLGQAEVYVSDLINTVWVRFYLTIEMGKGIYELPQNIKHITRITYRGFKVDMLSQKELSLLSPVYRTQQSRPRWASWQFDGYHSLRLYPVPAETLDPRMLLNCQCLNEALFNASRLVTSPYTDEDLLDTCTISAYLTPEEVQAPFFSLPDYFVSGLIRLFCLWKAYSSEGDGQDPDLANYYKKRFADKMKRVVEANTRVYNNKNRQLADVAIQRPWRKMRPILPPNFGTPVDMN